MYGLNESNLIGTGTLVCKCIEREKHDSLRSLVTLAPKRLKLEHRLHSHIRGRSPTIHVVQSF